MKTILTLITIILSVTLFSSCSDNPVIPVNETDSILVYSSNQICSVAAIPNVSENFADFKMGKWNLSNAYNNGIF